MKAAFFAVVGKFNNCRLSENIAVVKKYKRGYVVSIKIPLEKQIQSQIFAYTDTNTKEEVQLEIK